MSVIYVNIETGAVFRVGHGDKVVMECGYGWVRTPQYRPADLAHYPFIGIRTNC